MDHNGSGRLPAMAGPVKSGLLDDQDRVGGAVSGGIEGGLKDECGGLGSGITVAAGAFPQEGGPTTTGLERLGLLGTRGPACAAAARTPTSSCPISAASLAAIAAGRQASAMVLSPLAACPRASSPEVASSRARARSPGPQAAASQEREALRKAVPSSGPPAPPTVAMSVVATSLRTPPGLAGIPPAR